MNDLISRQAAIDKLRNNITYMQAFGCDRAITLIRELPSAQPELIRCKDCKHYDGRPCGIVDWYNTASDFCSKAERRSDG